MAEDLSKYNPEGSTLRKAQLCMLNILIEVDKICRKHKIEYFLDSGTLLGAVRHGGFIPWDDDLDIAIRSEDLPRLRKALQKELPDNLSYQDKTTDWNYFMTIGKVRDKKSVFNDPYFKRTKERGIYIDIFLVEPIVPLWLKDSVDFVYIRCLRGIHNYSDRVIEKILGYLFYLPSVIAVQTCKWIAKLFNSKKIGRAFGFKSVMFVDSDIIFPVREIKFEGHSFMAPNNIDAFLKNLYGDYMQIPPEDKRVTHLAEITFLDEEQKQ